MIKPYIVMFSDHNGIKLEIDDFISGISPNIWRYFEVTSGPKATKQQMRMYFKLSEMKT